MKIHQIYLNENNKSRFVRGIVQIVKANEDQYEAVRSFYHSLIDALKGSPI